MLLVDPLTVDRAVQVALLNNRTPQANFENLGIARGQLINASLFANPVIDFDVWAYGGGTTIEALLSEDLTSILYQPPRVGLHGGEFEATKRLVTARVVTLVGDVRLRPRVVTAAEMPATRPMPGVGPRSTTGPLPTSRPGRFDKYLRDMRNMAWRKKMVPGSTLERIYAQIERLNPDNPLPPGLPGVDYRPVVTPNNISMPFEIRGGVKVMHMVAEEVKHKFADGIECYTWGYNGRTHGPTIEAVEGERLRIYVTNKLPAPTTAVDGWRVLPENQEPAVTVFMPVGRTRDLEIVAMLEGHDPGYYYAPKRTIALPATREELARDGIIA